MSVHAMNWAWSVKVGSPAAKAVLVVLADFADQDHSCAPAVDLLSRFTELSEATTAAALSRLEEKRLLLVERKAGRPPRYVLNVGGGRT